VAIDRLPNLPSGADVFLDANVFIYSFSGRSNQCRDLLHRCSVEEVFGITTLEVINEVSHRLMLTEAVANGVVTRAHFFRPKSEV
jgi:predicted nucleic acid-binding protein